MKKIISAFAVFAMLGTTAAVAADVMTPVPAFDWSGGYVGLEGGYAFGSAAHTFSNGAPGGDSQPQGLMGGGFIGYNLQRENFLLGIEADALISGVSGKYNNTSGITSSGSASLKNQEDIRLRLGLPHGRLLPFVAGGIAFGNASFGGGPAGGPCCGYDAGLVGFTLGAGVEYAISDHLVTRLDYRYTNFGTASSVLAPTFTTVTMPVALQTHTIMLGLSYKF